MIVSILCVVKSLLAANNWEAGVTRIHVVLRSKVVSRS